VNQLCIGSNGRPGKWLNKISWVNSIIEALERHGLSQNDMGGALLAKPLMRYQLASLIRQLEIGKAENLAVG